MKLEVEELGTVPKSYGFELEPDAECLKDVPARFVSPLRATIEVWSEDGVIRSKGKLEGDAVRDCFRCLKLIESKLAIEFEAGFLTSDSDAESTERELSSDDLDFSVLTETALDLDEVAREQLMLALPDSVLCDDSCRGICPQCGKDLNESECECGSDDIDPRWKGLESLKKDLKN